MKDPTSDLTEDISPEEAATCGTCGEPLVEAPNRTVISWIDDGEVQTVDFCDEECRAAWDGEKG